MGERKEPTVQYKSCNRMKNRLTIDDVFPVHLDVVVPVGAGLFMVEAEGVEQLMLDGAVVQAALTAQRHSLTTASTTHIGVAAVGTYSSF